MVIIQAMIRYKAPLLCKLKISATITGSPGPARRPAPGERPSLTYGLILGKRHPPEGGVQKGEKYFLTK